MRIRLVLISVIMFFTMGVLVHAQVLTSDDLIEKIKSVVDMDMEQEDQIRLILGDYVDSINKVNDLIGKRVDQDAIDQKLSKANKALDLKLRNIFTPEQMHLWAVGKKVVYKEILATTHNDDQLQ